MRVPIVVLAVMLLTVAAGCSMTTEAKDFNGLTTPAGNATHMSTTNIAVHLLFTKPVMGDATLPTTVSDYTAAAKAAGGAHTRIVQSNVTTYWWIFPPISFVIHPVVSNVAGDVMK